MNKLRRPRYAMPLVALAAAACATSGGGSAEGTPSSSADPSASAPGSAAHPYLRFNDLGGGSTVIMVYPGTTESDADKTYNGTFNNGDTAAIVCQQPGRQVTSHPDVGEAYRQSSVWYRLGGVPVHFATAVYGDVQPPGAVVPACPLGGASPAPTG